MNERQPLTYPTLHAAASKASARLKRRTLGLVRLELGLAALAAGGGLRAVKVSGVDATAWVSLLAFIGMLGAVSYRQLAKPEQAWLLARAQAESVKTLTWRHAVGGNPFPIGPQPAGGEAMFVGRLRDLVSFIGQRGLTLEPVEGDLVPTEIAALRHAELAGRKAAYETERLRPQIDWYRTNAKLAGQLADRWNIVAVGGAILGVLLGAARVAGLFSADALGLCATLFGVSIAWSQTNQFVANANAYAVTHAELQLALASLPFVGADEWAAFVAGAEDMISREHRMWLARGGHGDPLRTEPRPG